MGWAKSPALSIFPQESARGGVKESFSRMNSPRHFARAKQRVARLLSAENRAVCYRGKESDEPVNRCSCNPREPSAVKA